MMDKDPFDALHSNFKQPLPASYPKLPNYAYEPTISNSLALVLYQIVYFVLTPLSGDDLQTYSSIP